MLEEDVEMEEDASVEESSADNSDEELEPEDGEEVAEGLMMMRVKSCLQRGK